MKRTRVKICGFKERKSLLTAIDCGVDAVGIICYPKSKRYITVDKASVLLKGIGPFVDVVAVFVNPSEQEVWDVVNTLPVTYLQFHGDEQPMFCESFKRPYIKAVGVNDKASVEKAVSSHINASALLLDTVIQGERGGTGKVFDWQLIPKRLEKPILLAGGLDLTNVEMAIETVKPYGVDLSSGVENQSGSKDSEKICQLMRIVNKSCCYE